MKKIKAISIFVLLVALSLCTIFTISSKDIEVKATESVTPSISIYKNNVSYASELYILYAVSYENIDITTNEIQLLFFDEIKDEYIKGNEVYYSTSKGKTTISGNTCLIFYSKGLAAKQMTDDIYTRAYVNINGVDYYSEVNKFSVLEYVYKTKETSSQTLMLNFLQKMLEYGSLAQQVLNYKLDRLADATYYNINVVNGSLSDGFSQGRVKENEVITLKANEKEGYVFTNWTDSLGNIVSSDKEYSFTVTKSENYKANYIEVKVIDEIKFTDTVAYNATKEDITLPIEASFEYNGSTLTVPIEFDTTSFIENKIGKQKLYATVTDNTVFINNLVTINEIYIEVEVLPYALSLSNNEYTITKYYGSEEVVEIPSSYKEINITTIGGSSFSNNTSIKEVVIPQTIKSIRYDAFLGCSSLENINVPSSVESLGNGVFSGCTNLENIEFNANIKTIDNSTFLNCSSLKEIVLPETLETIGGWGFYGCSSLTTITLPNSLISIGKSSFNGCSNLSSVIINEESSLTTIGEYAFAYNTKLESIVLQESLQTISDYAFYYCTNLKTIYNNSNISVVTGSTENGYIGYYATKVIGKYIVDEIKVSDQILYGQTLDDVTLPKTVSFNYNEEVVTLDVEFDTSSFIVNQAGVYKFNATVLDDTYLTENYIVINEIYFELEVLPYELSLNSTTNEYTITGYHGSEEVVNIPESYKGINITRIAQYAFEDCLTIKELNMTSTITYIEQGAIYFCDNIEKITIPFVGRSLNESNISYKHFGYIFGATSYYSQNDLLPINMVKVKVLSASKKFNGGINGPIASGYELPDYAFYNCSLLKEIIMPIGNYTVEDYAFYNCTSLTNITIPSSVTSIGRNAFENCTSLTNITIPSSITSIGYEAFYRCSTLTNITIPNSVTSIGERSFYNCESLKNVYYEGTIEDWCKIPFENYYSNPMYYASHFYLRNSNNEWEEITKIEIPSTLTTIGYQFIGFENITNITIPSGVTSIVSQAFENCTSLTNVIFEEGSKLASIGERSFYNCTSLTNIIIPSRVTSIGRYAFYNCTSLTNITIPSRVTIIGYAAFENCTSLKDVYYDETFEEWCNIDFESTSSNPMYYANQIYMKKDNDEYYEVKEITIPETMSIIGYQFIGFNMSSLTIPSRVTSIGSSAFSNCTSLTNVTIPSSVTSIGSSAFSNCTSLTNVTIPSSVTSIGSSAFYKCTSLTNITIPSGVTSIGSSAFYNCTSLTNITIPNSVTSIGDNAFYKCTSLTNITIPSSVTSIGSSAFNNCYNLKEVYNESELVFTPGSSSYGYIAYYALKVVNKGVVSYKNNATVYEYFTTEDGFKFLNFNNTYYLISYTGTDEVPTLPALVNGKTYKCQYMDSTLKNIKLSTDFISIHDSMFQYCSYLESIEIPNSITSIGNYAFKNCTSLTNITIPSGVTSIGSDAFIGCYNLGTIINYSDLVFTKGSTSNGYIAYYAKNIYVYVETYEISVVNGKILNELTTGIFEKNSTVILKASSEKDLIFLYWIDSNNNIISESETFELLVKENNTYTAIFGDASSIVEEISLIVDTTVTGELLFEEDIFTYLYSNTNYTKITIKVDLNIGYKYSKNLVFIVNGEIIDSSKYTIEYNHIKYTFDDPNWSVVV